MVMSSGGCLKLIDVERPSQPWVAPFPRQGVLNCIRMQKLEYTQASDYLCIRFALLLTLDKMQQAILGSCCLNFLAMLEWG